MRWMWIDTIVDYEPERRLVAVKNVSLAEEHMHDHVADEATGRPVMPASLMIEGMAQTAGILVGSINRFAEKVILAKITRAELERDVLPGQTLRYEAEVDRIDGVGAATRGVVRCLDHGRPGGAESDWETIGHVDLMFSHVDRNLAGVEFPEENFVFSENFRTILRAAGLDQLCS
jgi:3-hydroxyacyl-[acyl-carrier-protein] dehydratase